MSEASLTRPEPSESQWEAIRTVDDHLLVAAGAGTGKTTTVVEKILYLLGVPVRDKVVPTPMRLDDIAAITFTNKAAAELKARLRAALRLAGRRADAYQIDNARVGTIHAFCGDILGEFSLRSGRPPSLALLEEGESEVLRDEVIHEVLLEAIESGSIASLSELLSSLSLSDVERGVGRLIDQGDHLAQLANGAAMCSPAEQALLDLAELAQAGVAMRLAASGAMDFDRMITWTRDLMRDDLFVRRALQQRIKVLIIDEFQDVDPVQREIAYLLGEPASARKDCTRLVLVGDPKQSIFRFRRADVTVWRSVERDFASAGYGRLVTLAENRRSVPGILGFVDHAIGSLLDTPVLKDATSLEDFEVGYERLKPTRPIEGSAPAVEFWVVPPLENAGTGAVKAQSAETVRLSDARAAARRARELHDHDGIAWRDMAVLLTGWTDLAIYVEALQAEGVPHYALRTEGFFERREVVDVLLALETIRNPGDDRAFMGFLRSPFVGLTDESLLRIAWAGPSSCWQRIDGVSLPDGNEAALLTRAVETLRLLIGLRDRIATAALIDELLLETGYCAHLALLGDDGKQRIANVRKLVRTAASLPEIGLGEFLRSVARERESTAARVGDARLYGERDDVVTVSSVHGAKGLEWRVVFWCDLNRKPHPLTEKLLIGRSRIALGEPDIAADDQREAWRALRDSIAAESVAEAKRLWYVAATRAKDLLILSGIPVTAPSSARADSKPAAVSVAAALKTVFPALNGNAAVLEYKAGDGTPFTATIRPLEVVVAATPTSVIAPVSDAATLGSAREAITIPIGRARHSATELIALQRCGRRHWLKYVLGLREPAIERRDSSVGEIDAIKRGLIVHSVLERASDDADLEILLETAIEEHDVDAPARGSSQGDSYRLELASEIKKVLALPEYRSVADTPATRRELRFLHIDAPGRFAEGAIDVCAPGKDGYTILDVKTSQCDAEAAARKAEGYNEQRDAYVRAVEAISGRRVASFVLQFTAAGVMVGGPITPELREAGLLQLRRAVERISAPVPELTRHPHECRYCGYREVGWCEGALRIDQSIGAETLG